MQVHVLDATYELFRAHFGRPPSVDVQGRPAGATLGLVESVLGLLRDPQVTHVGCATDHAIRSWRNERYAGYKTEAGMPAELLAQFGFAESALRALGLVVWPMTDYEADDALATAAARWADAPGVDRVVIMSPDKDLAQCVRTDGRVVAFDRRRERTIDADAVRSRFGVEPESIPDWLALVGDAADGFPGLRGWGERSASTVLSCFRHLEGIPADADDWGVPLRNAETLAATLRAGRAEAELYRELATLRLDVPLPETLEALAWRGVPRGPFARLVEQLRAPHLTARVPRWSD